MVCHLSLSKISIKLRKLNVLKDDSFNYSKKFGQRQLRRWLQRSLSRLFACSNPMQTIYCDEQTLVRDK